MLTGAGAAYGGGYESIGETTVFTMIQIKHDIPCQSASAWIFTPRSTSQSIDSIAVCSVLRIGLAIIATSSGLTSEKRSSKLCRSLAHCSSPSSVNGGS